MSRVIRSEAALAELLAKPGYRVREQFKTSTPDAATRKDAGELTPPENRKEVGPREKSTTSGTLKVGPITLPWPPSGNSAVRHAMGAHYLQPVVIAYRDSVAALCARFKPIAGQYRLHVHLSPPDARRRDADNALKSLLDAIVKAGYVQDDSLAYMRELLVTTDDERRGVTIVRAIPIDFVTPKGFP